MGTYYPSRGVWSSIIFHAYNILDSIRPYYRIDKWDAIHVPQDGNFDAKNTSTSGPSPKFMPEIIDNFYARKEIQDRLIEELEQNPDTDRAISLVGGSQTTLWRYRKLDQEFNERYLSTIRNSKEVELPTKLVNSAIERATEGTVVPEYYGPKDEEYRAYSGDGSAADKRRWAMSGPNVKSYKMLPPDNGLLRDLLKAYVPEFKQNPANLSVNLSVDGQDWLVGMVDRAYESLKAAGKVVDKKKLRKNIIYMFSSEVDDQPVDTESTEIS